MPRKKPATSSHKRHTTSEHRRGKVRDLAPKDGQADSARGGEVRRAVRDILTRTS